MEIKIQIADITIAIYLLDDDGQCHLSVLVASQCIRMLFVIHRIKYKIQVHILGICTSLRHIHMGGNCKFLVFLESSPQSPCHSCIPYRIIFSHTDYLPCLWVTFGHRIDGNVRTSFQFLHYLVNILLRHHGQGTDAHQHQRHNTFHPFSCFHIVSF